MKQRLLSLAISTAVSASMATAMVVATPAMASGYKLNEQGASGAGNAYAGRAAVVEDASVVFYNPAGMVKLTRPELTVGASVIDATGSFELDSYRNAAGHGDVSGNGGDFIPLAKVPYAYFAMPINDQWAAGVGVFVPFGTNTDYSDDFAGLGFADQTQLKSLDIQPAVAYRLNDQLSLGFGLDISYMKGLLSKSVDTVPYNPQLKYSYGQTDPRFGMNPVDVRTGQALTDEQWADYQGSEYAYQVEGDDWNVGYNLSLMWDISEKATLGVTYRSQIEFELKGDSEFDQKTGVVGLAKAPAGQAIAEGTYIIAPVDFGKTLTPTGAVPNQASKVPLTTPQSLTISYAHQVTDELQLLAGGTWTQWSVFESFDVISTESQTGMIEGLSQLGNGYIGHIEENWNDTTAIALGASYQLNDQWLLRTGYANDQSPVSNTYRTARVPGSDREWISAGFNYVVNQDMDVDFALSYAFISPSKIDEQDRTLDNQVKLSDPSNPNSYANITGEYNIDVLAYSFQVNYKL